MAEILNGKELARQIRLGLSRDLAKISKKPSLAVVLAGDDPGSKVYVNSKEKAATEIGMESVICRLPSKTSQQELIEIVKKLNADNNINGILVQLPLPKHIKEEDVFAVISPKKDVDGLHPMNMGRLLLGQEPYFYPCTPSGIMEMIRYSKIGLKGMNAVIIGRSNIVGKPMAQLLMREHATVTICHSRTKDIKFFTKAADIIVVAIGKPKFLTKDMVKEGAVIIDVGMNRLETGLVGDVDFENVKDVCSYITPVPGGVGPMTIAMLMKNCFEGFMKYGNTVEIQ
ncbi:MAG: bifunctional methylenetetrahydrofolate dehydrogenase/methenyltetrahydrofolate cyclohydrolase FolD [Candidatus Margulisiibacteriota bacterium]